MSSSSSAALDLAKLETESKLKAQAQVAGLLQRPDQLEKVEQIRKRVSRKKSSVEAMLKTAVQSQLDGVRTGLAQLQNALRDIQEIKQSLDEMEETNESILGLGEKLKKVREENSRHSQLGAAVENLKHIFNVPETVRRCEELIAEGKLLHAHKCLTDLEHSRDDLLFELHKQTTQSPTDKNTVKIYFSDVDRLSESLGKQLWVILHRMHITIRREPTMIVTVLRIIEREEKTDAVMLKRYDQTGFWPPGRPKRWKAKAFTVLEEAVRARVEGSQMEDRTLNKMWLVRHLELNRQLVIEDLRVVKTIAENCFPPHWNILNKYVEMYHTGISQHLNEIVMQGLEGNEIITVMNWMHEYESPEMMGHPELKIDISDLGPLLPPTVVSQLQNKYLQMMRSNFQEWMANSLKTDKKDWYEANEPQADDRGYFNTTLPLLLFQMIEQNLQVADTIGKHLVASVIGLFIDELQSFIIMYKDELQKYQQVHMADRSQPQFFLHYMIANINNCKTFSELTVKIQAEHLSDVSARYNISQEKVKRVANEFNMFAQELCDAILEEVFMDLDTHVQELLSRKWLHSSNAVDTICITVEDYCQDFVHLKDAYYQLMLERAQTKVAMEYLKAVFSRKMTFKNYQERLPGAEKMMREAEQFRQLFTRLSDKLDAESPFDALPGLAEVLKMRDTSMMSLEISGFANDYPDVRMDQLINLMMMRGDIGRNNAREIVVDSLGDDHDIKPKSKKTIFSNSNL